MRFRNVPAVFPVGRRGSRYISYAGTGHCPQPEVEPGAGPDLTADRRGHRLQVTSVWLVFHGRITLLSAPQGRRKRARLTVSLLLTKAQSSWATKDPDPDANCLSLMQVSSRDLTRRAHKRSLTWIVLHVIFSANLDRKVNPTPLNWYLVLFMMESFNVAIAVSRGQDKLQFGGSLDFLQNLGNTLRGTRKRRGKFWSHQGQRNRY